MIAEVCINTVAGPHWTSIHLGAGTLGRFRWRSDALGTRGDIPVSAIKLTSWTLPGVDREPMRPLPFGRGR